MTLESQLVVITIYLLYLDENAMEPHRDYLELSVISGVYHHALCIIRKSTATAFLFFLSIPPPTCLLYAGLPFLNLPSGVYG